ncbi:MAG: tetratricopeptide repeat protein [Pyrinomonadaceae bacterium]
MRIIKYISTLCLLLVFAHSATLTASAQRRRTGIVPGSTATADSATGDEGEQAELRAILALPAAERIEKLKTFVEAHPRSALKSRAQELIVSSRAALGDEKLKTGDETGGMEQFRLAVTESPANMSEKLYTEVIATLPLNLFLRGKRAESLEIARLIEARVKEDAKRLVALASFYLNIEEVNEATRTSELAVKLAPDLAAAHQSLGAAYHIALRLDDAAQEYARALELDPKLASARRSLADLRRAGGKGVEALALYREQLAADPADKAARAGVAMSLLETGERAEGARELEAVLTDDPRNFALLTGAAYWYAAHDDGARALELAEKAVQVEPRYTWAQIALGRALLAQKRPLDAERVLRFARQYGRFPTLDYELATTLAAAGLYEEAATELARSFTLKDGQLETQLAGRTPSSAPGFIELLALERRASIFQFTAADSEENARMLKNLLAFQSVMNPAGGRESVRETDATSAAQAFAAGEDNMRVYRQLYAANRLLQNRLAFQTVLELAEAAITGVDAALDAPAATVATLADNLIEIRARAIASGSTPSVPDVPRNVRSNILRGRIEDMMGTALFNQDKTAEAVVHLRRAVSVLPEETIWLRTALWHLGAALEATGKQPEALAVYIKSYRSSQPDPARRTVIETLYRKVNGSLDGLDAALGAPATVASNSGDNSSSSSSSGSSTTSAPPPESASPAVTTAPSPTTSPAPSSEPTSDDQRDDVATATETPTPTPAPPVADPAATLTLEPSPSTSSVSTAPAEQPAESRSSTCLIAVSEDTLSIRNNGGSTVITIKLMGWKGAGEVTAATANWPDIAVFPEPKSTTEAGSFKYSITSVSRSVGTFYVTFKSPCGEKLVEVKVL